LKILFDLFSIKIYILFAKFILPLTISHTILLIKAVII